MIRQLTAEIHGAGRSSTIPALLVSFGPCYLPLVPAAPIGKTTLPLELEERMWELEADGFLTWTGGGSQIPEPVAVNRGPGLLSDSVVENRE